MYSRWQPPRGVIRLKRRTAINPRAWSCGRLVTDSSDGNTWVVWDRDTGILEAIFYSVPNQHGFSASEAHAKSYLSRASPVNPFELDNIA